MAYNPDLLKEIRDRNVETIVSQHIIHMLGDAVAFEDAKRIMNAEIATLQAHCSGEARDLKVISHMAGNLVILLEKLEEDDTVQAALEQFRAKNCFFADYHYEKVSEVDNVTDAIAFLKSEVEQLTLALELLTQLGNGISDLTAPTFEFWQEILTGSPPKRAYMLKYTWLRNIIHKFVIKWKKEHPPAEKPKEADSYGTSDGPESYGGGERGASYAEKARPKEAEPSVDPPVAHARWGDYSDGEESDDLSSLLQNFKSAGVDSKPFIEVPEDFDSMFPSVYKAWSRILAVWGWDLKKTDCSFHSEGFVAPMYGKANDSERAKILAGLDDNKRIALNTFVSFLISVLWKPESIAVGEQASLVSGFVTALFLRESCKKSDKKLSLLKASLKGSDAGESIIQFRVASCFTTGSKCSGVFMKAIMKMLRKLVDKTSAEDKKSVLGHASELCFTSAQGMMQNCFRTVSKKTIVEEESKTKGGKTRKSRKSVMKKGKDRPNLNAKGLELTTDEYEVIRSKESSFNRLDEVIEEILTKVESTEPLATATVVKHVVDLAYDKISALRHLNKTRRNSIRAEAQRLAGDGKDLTSAHWAKAKKEVISSWEEIAKSTLSNLEWDVDSLIKEIQIETI